MLKIVITGGHHTPALSVIEALKGLSEKSSEDLSFFWIGHKYSMWADTNISAEYREVTASGIPFFDLKAGKFYKTYNLLKLIRIPLGFIHAFVYLLKIRPDIIISFGGYLAVPVVFSAWLLRITIVTHEQTTVAGTASLFISRFARKIFISFASSGKFFPKEKICLVGNPIRSEIFADRGLFCFADGPKTLYITGGKQGSHKINTFVAKNLIRFLSSYNVIHQSGSSSVYGDYDNLLKLRENLSSELRERYLVKDFFNAEEIGSVFARADIVISRAGANAVYEIGALGKVALLIPIPWSSRNEQELNARFLSSGGAAALLEEKDLTEKKFFPVLEDLSLNCEFYRNKAGEFSKKFPLNGAETIAELVMALLNSGD